VAGTTLQVWAGPLSDGSIGVILFNRGTSSASITANFTDIGLTPNSKANVRDLWAHQDLGAYTGSFSQTVPTHASITLRVTPTSWEERQAVIRSGEQIVANAARLRAEGQIPAGVNTIKKTHRKKHL